MAHPKKTSVEKPSGRTNLGAAPTSTRVVAAFGIAAALLFAGLMLRGAWVCDDAFITFRSVEQLFAGNGPVWNAGVRAQAFTHPLWFGVLAVGRWFTRDIFIVAIVAGAVFSIAAFALLLARFGGRSLPRLLFLAVAIFASQAFVDFSTSGLENSLLNLLLVLFLATYLGPGDAHRRLLRMVFCASLMLLCRHDSVTLWLAPLAVVAVEVFRFGRPGKLRITGALFAAASPFLFWTLFSLVYYGVPFPNTAYAKLGAGIPALDLARQGLYYGLNAFRWDPVTPLCILAGIVLPWFAPDRRLRWLSVGLVLNCLYVVRVGGDFMAGRFWISAFLVSLVVIVVSARATRFYWVGVVIVLGFMVSNPQSPPRFNPALDPEQLLINRIDEHGIADEKKFYITTNSLSAWLRRDPWLLFPQHPWVASGVQFRTGPESVAYIGNIGMFGYFAGTTKTIVDGLALTDPFLARLPAVKSWRIGHFPRVLPAGYLDSVKEGRNLVADPELAAKYDQVVLVTQGPLFSWPRALAIVEFNTGISLRKAHP